MTDNDVVIDVSSCRIGDSRYYDLTKLWRGQDSEVDYRDLKIDRPIWSIAHSKKTGKFYGALDGVFYGGDDPEFECVWLR